MPIRARDPNRQPERQNAETVAIQALGWIAGDEDRLARFMALAGLSVDELRIRAAEPEFLGGVFDFVLNDETLLLDFAQACDIKPDALLRLRRHLPGAPVWD